VAANRAGRHEKGRGKLSGRQVRKSYTANTQPTRRSTHAMSAGDSVLLSLPAMPSDSVPAKRPVTPPPGLVAGAASFSMTTGRAPFAVTRARSVGTCSVILQGRNGASPARWGSCWLPVKGRLLTHRCWSSSWTFSMRLAATRLTKLSITARYSAVLRDFGAHHSVGGSRVVGRVHCTTTAQSLQNRSLTRLHNTKHDRLENDVKAGNPRH
jgi:hypothetical protein